MSGPDPQTLRDRAEQYAQNYPHHPVAVALIRDLLAAPPQWQPIATAPKDGTAVLLCWPFWCPRRPTIGVFGLHGVQQWFAPETLEGDGDGPTHWMPLPAPPAPRRSDAPEPP